MSGPGGADRVRTATRLPWVWGAAGLATAFTTFPFRDPDVWWHLALGRIITAHGIPAVEPLSFEGAPNPWIGQQWLYEVTLARLVDAGGAGLAMVVMGLVGALALAVAGLSTRRSETSSGPASAAAVIGGGLIAASVLGVRGQVVTVLFTAVTLLVLVRWREGSVRILAVLPPLTVLWVNLHAGVVTGIAVTALVGMVVAAHRALSGPGAEPRAHLRPLLAVFLLSVAATLLNPAGPHLWGYVASTFANPTLTNGITEWMSPDFHTLWFRFAAALVVLVVITWVRGPRPDPVDAALLGATVVATLQAQRNVALLAVVLVPRLAVALTRGQSWLSGRRAARPRRTRSGPPVGLAWGTAAVVTAATLASVVLPAAGAGRTATWEREHEPHAAASWVLAHRGGARVYSTYEWGGYLAERFAPQRMVWIYGESAVFGDARLRDYLTVHNLAAGWRDTLATTGMHVAVLPATAREAVALLEVGWTPLCHDRAGADAVVLEAGVPPSPGAVPPDPRASPDC